MTEEHEDEYRRINEAVWEASGHRIAEVQDAGHAGWFHVALANGTALHTMTRTELVEEYGVDPYETGYLPY